MISPTLRAAMVCTIAAIGAAVIVTPAKAASADLEAAIDAAMSEMEALNLPVVVGIAFPDGGTRYAAFGVLDEMDLPPQHIQVELASVTKTITAAMVLALVDDGDLALDDTIGDLLSDVPADKADITIHQLLTHAAGIALQVGDDVTPMGKADHFDELLNTPLLAQPGQAFAYSNPGYGLLAALIEHVTGKTYEAYLAEMLASAKLPSMGYADVYDPAKAVIDSNGETIVQASWRASSPSWHLIGNGGLVGTAEAILAFEHAFRTGTLAGQTLANAAYSEQMPEDPDGLAHYGYGMSIVDDPELGRLYGHEGSFAMYGSQWLHIAEDGITLFAAGLDNDDGSAFEAIDLMLDHVADP